MIKSHISRLALVVSLVAGFPVTAAHAAETPPATPAAETVPAAPDAVADDDRRHRQVNPLDDRAAG
jgi:hypothetical protein